MTMKFQFLPVVVFLTACGPAEPEKLKISLEAGHIHVFHETSITFRVQDMTRCTDPADAKTCPGVSGLAVVASHEARGLKQVQELQAGVLEDKGEGKYVWTRAFPYFGPNVVTLRFTQGEKEYFAAFPLETSRGGGERYFCDRDSDGTVDYVYQIRWNTSTGEVKANGTPVTLSLELVRSFNAPPLNTDQPWLNSFEHLRPSELEGGLPIVKLMADTGSSATEIQTLVPTYMGKGLYTVSYPFTASQLASRPERMFWTRVQFRDDKGCAVDNTSDPEEYTFPVTP